MSHRICCAGVDTGGNAMDSAVCRLMMRTNGPELRNVSVACLAPDTIDITFTANQPGSVAFAVLPPAVGGAQDSDADPSWLFDPAGLPAAAAHGQMAYETPGLAASVGACDVQGADDFVAFLAMRSIGSSTRFSAVLQLAFNMSDICSRPEGLLCEPHELLRPLQPRMQVMSGSALLVGPGQLSSGLKGLVFRQVLPSQELLKFGEMRSVLRIVVARCEHTASNVQDLAFADTAPPGALIELQALAGDRPARPLLSIGPNPNPAPLALSTAAGPVHRVRLVACTPALYIEDALVSGDSSAGRQLSCTFAVQDSAGRSVVNTDGLRLRLMLQRVSGVRVPVDATQDCAAAAVNGLTGVAVCTVVVPARHFPGASDTANAQVAMEVQVRFRGRGACESVCFLKLC